MGTVSYTVINGEVVSENRNGALLDYVPDPLGSTVAMLDNTQTITDTFTYWPYGEVVNRSGTTPTQLQYVGTLGYYKDNASTNVKTYVRNRYLDHAKCRWLTEDPLWFGGGDYNLYRYVQNNPMTEVDPSGQAPACYFRDPFNPTAPPCVGITNTYAAFAQKSKLAACASCVSAALCEAIRGCYRLEAAFYLGDFALAAKCAFVLTVIQCQNICMFMHWLRRDLRQWDTAKRICNQYGNLSTRCCHAEVEAEQTGYTLCAKNQCPSGLAWWNQSSRIRYGKWRCC